MTNKKVGDIPGNPVFTGKKKLDNTYIRIIEYNSENYKNTENILENNFQIDNSNSLIKWINISGLHLSDTIINFCTCENIHTLHIEDILNTSHRPKIESNNNYIFIILKLIKQNANSSNIDTEQISFILKNNTLITFRETKDNSFDAVIERIKNSHGIIRKNGSDYLMFSLIDIIFDNYHNIVEKFGEEINDLDYIIVNEPTKKTILSIYNNKKRLNVFRKHINPVNEVLLSLSKIDCDLINKKTKPYIKDLNDIVLHINEKLDQQSSILNDYLSIYHSFTNNRLNEIMKLLSIYASIFIPLTFLTGVYGMNFDFFPEIHYKYSYFIFWLIVIIIVLGLLIYYKLKKWL